MKTPTNGAIALLGISALLAAGCGKSSKASSAVSTTPPNTAAQSSTSAAVPTSSAPGTMLTIKRAGKLGTVLAAGSKNMTVYLFEADKGAASNCSGACTASWPPVTTSGSPVAGKGAMAADLGTIKRSDGTTQVTYKGHPLYYFVKDKDSGDSYGEGVVGFGAAWYAVSPAGSKVDNS